MSISCEIELERRPFKTPTFAASQGLQKDRTTIMSPNHQPTESSRRPFKSLTFMADGEDLPPGRITCLTQQGTMTTYSVNGKQLWTTNALRHPSAHEVYMTGMCYGADQHLFCSQYEQFKVPDFFGDIYYRCWIYEFDKNGEFVRELDHPFQLIYNNLGLKTCVRNASNQVAFAGYTSDKTHGWYLDGSAIETPVPSSKILGQIAIDGAGNTYINTDDQFSVGNFWVCSPNGDIVRSNVTAAAAAGAEVWAVNPEGTVIHFWNNEFHAPDPLPYTVRSWRYSLVTGDFIQSSEGPLDSPVVAAIYFPWGGFNFRPGSDIDAHEVGSLQLYAYFNGGELQWRTTAGVNRTVVPPGVGASSYRHSFVAVDAN